ncbi:MAG: hypothetical protein A3E80_00115 [Chlamydiae bacterium RIFCSPHIGHO2_12_FULL_49_9]|nr:MAG: hypothetical protein A3E80_00115 [Chlamydiae bacterium RIFCSPHIGHO2_12_FULL_49_9]
MHEFESLSQNRLLKPSNRSAAEQITGLLIFSMSFFLLEIFNRTVVKEPLLQETAWTLYYLLISTAMWILWRRFSLRVIKLEFSGFLLALILQIIWGVDCFGFKETLPTLFALTLLWCNNLVATVLFWKKEKLSGALFLLPFLWSLYVMGENMIKCISNP